MKKVLMLVSILLVICTLWGCNQDCAKCSDCGQKISETAQFCPYCGSAINKDQTNSAEEGETTNRTECEHSFEDWITINQATCTSSGTKKRTCSKCKKSETQSIPALGHTTDCGLCSRCNVRTGWTKEEVQSYIKVYSVYVSNINSVGGVDMKIGWENTSSKTIKYVYFTVEAYNAVWDKVYCTIRDYNKFTGYSTGPFAPGYTNLSYWKYSEDDYYDIDNVWENCYYNNSIKYLVLTNIRVVFMDNTEIKIDEKNIDYCFADYPSGLFYQWNDEYNGYEVEYRMKNESTATIVTIPNTYNNKPVVSLGYKAFYSMTNIKKIKLPSTLKRISGSAFMDCTNLQEIEIPNGVTTIETFSFDGCSALTKVTMPKSVTQIEYGIFGGCNNLELIYKGTAEEWEKIAKDKNWSYGSTINISYIGDSESDVSKEIDDSNENGMTVVHVSSGIDFLNSIGNNTKIIIDSESIDLSGISNCANPNVHKCEFNSGFILSNIQNMIIIGNATILINDRYADVLSFQYCDNIILSGLTVGHILAESTYKCDGAVVKISFCNTFTLNECKLFGCGADGLSSFRSKNVKLDQCQIYECNFTGLYLFETDIDVTKCSFYDCSFDDYGGMIKCESSSASFTNCMFDRLEADIFINIDDYFSEDSIVTFSACAFENNKYSQLTNESSKTHFDDCSFVGNNK